jgi:hypothetical protein
MSLLAGAEKLPFLVSTKFASAKASGALKLASSHLSILDVGGTAVGMADLDVVFRLFLT